MLSEVIKKYKNKMQSMMPEHYPCAAFSKD